MHPDKINSIKKLLERNEVNPRDIKMLLARTIISLYHSDEELFEAEENFKAKYQKKNSDIELPIIYYDEKLLTKDGICSLIDCIYSIGTYKSKGEVRRLIQQGAVKINGEKTNEFVFEPTDNTIIQVGKGKIFKLQPLNNEKMKIKCLKD